jgi:formiminotetrahydrofolate cyclodeaminase
MSALSSRTVSDLYDMACSSATPGGGAVTILCGYLGVGLILKALRVSRNKTPDIAVLGEVAEELQAAAPKLARFADADNESFQAYLDAAKLPKASSEQTAQRKSALSDAAEQAAVAAIEAYELGRGLIASTRKAEANVAPVIKADITAGVELLGAMCIVAKENAHANLPGISDAAKRSTLTARLD